MMAKVDPTIDTTIPAQINAVLSPPGTSPKGSITFYEFLLAVRAVAIKTGFVAALIPLIQSLAPQLNSIVGPSLATLIIMLTVSVLRMSQEESKP